MQIADNSSSIWTWKTMTGPQLHNGVGHVRIEWKLRILQTKMYLFERNSMHSLSDVDVDSPSFWTCGSVMPKKHTNTFFYTPKAPVSTCTYISPAFWPPNLTNTTKITYLQAWIDRVKKKMQWICVEFCTLICNIDSQLQGMRLVKFMRCASIAKIDFGKMLNISVWYWI